MPKKGYINGKKKQHSKRRARQALKSPMGTIVQDVPQYSVDKIQNAASANQFPHCAWEKP